MITFLTDFFYNLLIFFTWLIPGHYVWVAVVIITILIRLAFMKPTYQMLKTQGKQKNIQHKLSAIKQQFPNDQKAQQQATMELYKQEGINPLGSCLPMIVQIILLLGFYGVFRYIGFDGVNLEKLYSFTPHPSTINPWFFGADLTKTVAELVKGPVGWVAILFPVFTGLTQMYQSIQAKALQPKPAAGDKAADFSRALNLQMTYLMPVLIAYISYTLPSALSIYWITQTLAMVVQQHFMIKKLKDEEVVVEEIAEALEAKNIQEYKKGGVTVTVREKK